MGQSFIHIVLANWGFPAFYRIGEHWRESGVKRFIMSKEIPVEFLNPRRPVRSWCDGYLQPEKRIKKGVSQVRVFMQGSPSYFIWVAEANVYRHV